MDSEAESEDFADYSDGEHNNKEKTLVLASILGESSLTAEGTSPRPHLSTAELDKAKHDELEMWIMKFHNLTLSP